MIRELAGAGFEIGAHTADHIDLASVPHEDAELQMRQAKSVMEAHCLLVKLRSEDAALPPRGLGCFDCGLLPSACH